MVKRREQLEGGGMFETVLQAGAPGQGFLQMIEDAPEIEGVVQGVGDQAGVIAEGGGGLDPGAGGIGPARRDQEPVLKEDGQELGVDLAKDPPWLGRAPLVEEGGGLPELEEPFDLPA